MKRFITLMMVIVTLLTFSVNVMAADLEFVPSIEDKGAPDVVTKDDGKGGVIVGVITDANGNTLSTEKEECIIITPIREASSANLTEAEKKELLAVYEELKDKGADALPGLTKDDLAIRDLFKVSSNCNDIKEFLPVDGNTLALTFNLNLGAKAHVEAMIYADGAWSKLPVVNNGDGTVTATFEKFGIVAFLTESTGDSPDTGDASGADQALWISLMAVSAALLVALAVVARRKSAKK